jgi:O-antigen/teichoic acid export membrane protein
VGGARSGVARGAGTTGLFVGLLAALALANNIVVANLVGPEGRGLYALAVSVLAIAGPAAAWGVQAANTFFTAGAAGAAAVVPTSLRLVAVVASASALGLTAAMLVPAPLDVRLPVAAAIAAVPAFAAHQAAMGLLLGQSRLVLFNASSVTPPLLLLVAHASTLWFGRHFVVINLALSMWLAAGVWLAIAVRGVPRPWSQHAPEGYWRYGGHSAATTLLEGALLRLDYLILGPWLGPVGLGLYAVADQLTNTLLTLAQGLGRVAFAGAVLGGEREARAMLFRTYRLTVGLLVVAGAIGWATFDRLIPLVFGADFAAAYPLFVATLPALLLRSAAVFLTAHLAARNVPEAGARAGLPAAILNVALLVPLALAFTWQGAVAARLAAYALQVTVLVAIFRSVLGAWPDLTPWPSIADLKALRRPGSRRGRSQAAR